MHATSAARLSSAGSAAVVAGRAPPPSMPSPASDCWKSAVPSKFPSIEPPILTILTTAKRRPCIRGGAHMLQCAVRMSSSMLLHRMPASIRVTCAASSNAEAVWKR
eukprot:1045140-Prymnesium_polylepis.1